MKWDNYNILLLRVTSWYHGNCHLMILGNCRKESFHSTFHKTFFTLRKFTLTIIITKNNIFCYNVFVLFFLFCSKFITFYKSLEGFHKFILEKSFWEFGSSWHLLWGYQATHTIFYFFFFLDVRFILTHSLLSSSI